MLCVDGKRVTPGLDKTNGDVNMFGFEDGPTVEDRKKKLDLERNVIKEIKDSFLKYGDSSEIFSLFKSDERSALNIKLKSVIHSLSIKIQDSRETKRKQDYALLKLKKLGGDEWRTSKYVFAISSIQAQLTQLKEFIYNALRVVGQLCEMGAFMNGTESNFKSEGAVNVSSQGNFIRLKESNEETPEGDSRYTKQRSMAWHGIREKAMVTGSTLHDSIGLRTLKSMHQHIGERTGNKPRERHPPEVEVKLLHGTKNEIHALATLTSVFMPFYYPDLAYVEEGCYIVDGDNRKHLMVVSPDGSIRTIEPEISENGIFAVEVKCPFPSEHSSPVHYTMPHYYVCQCLAEMKVMNCHKLLYISHSSDSTVVLEAKFDENLWEEIWSEVKTIYDQDSPKKHSRLSIVSKGLKTKMKEYVQTKVELIGEFPSVQSYNTDNTSMHDITKFDDRFIFPSVSHSNKEAKQLLVGNVLEILESADRLLQHGYQLQRRKASEVMVWVLSNKNRFWRPEIPNSLPIAYGLKDYRFSLASMRKACDYVIEKCHEAGLKVPLLSFDGQWYQLMIRDSEDKPLTKYQLQRDVWKRATSEPKRKLVSILKDAGKVDVNDNTTLKFQKRESSIDLWSADNGIKNLVHNLYTRNKRTCLQPMQLQIDSKKDYSWIPDEITEFVAESTDRGTVKEVEEVVESVNIDVRDVLEDVSDPLENELELENVHRICSSIREALVVDKKWNTIQVQDINEMMCSREKLLTLSHIDLNTISTSVHQELQERNIKIPKSANKQRKVSELMKLFNVNPEPFKVKTTNKKMYSLKDLACKVLLSNKVHKAALNVAVASYNYPKALEKWQKASPFANKTVIRGVTLDYECYSIPERHPSTSELLCKCLDSHHILTNLRVRTSKNGIENVNSEAWKTVARSNKTRLSIAMVDDLLDKQNNAFAQTHFSEEVEDEMRQNSNTKEADFCKLIREWYNADDLPGIDSKSRVRKWLNLKEFLLDGVSFGVFPPLMQYIKGIPICTYEGLLVGIDTKIQLFELAGDYCVRTAGSLPAETCVGVLQDMNPSATVSVKARDINSIMSSLVELLGYKMNPDRGFYMKTSRASVYPQRPGENHSIQDEAAASSGDVDEHQIVPKNNLFDLPIRARVKGKSRLARISAPDEAARGAQPMRKKFFKCDESKILAEKRLGQSSMM